MSAGSNEEKVEAGDEDPLPYGDHAWNGQACCLEKKPEFLRELKHVVKTEVSDSKVQEFAGATLQRTTRTRNLNGSEDATDGLWKRHSLRAKYRGRDDKLREDKCSAAHHQTHAKSFARCSGRVARQMHRKSSALPRTKSKWCG